MKKEAKDKRFLVAIWMEKIGNMSAGSLVAACT
jgi:hypothetical protein